MTIVTHQSDNRHQFKNKDNDVIIGRERYDMMTL
jgi:hypothetical protein